MRSKASIGLEPVAKSSSFGWTSRHLRDRGDLQKKQRGIRLLVSNLEKRTKLGVSRRVRFAPTRQVRNGER